MAMADCEGEKTIHYEEDGWSVTLTRYVTSNSRIGLQEPK